MTRSSISIFLLVVGLLWAAVVSWLFVTLGGAAEPTFSGLAKSLLWFSWWFIGPVVLIAGALLMLRGNHQRAASLLCVLGCIILTLMVSSQTLSVIHDAADPLIMKPPYAEYALAIMLTLLADAGAVQLYRLASLAAMK
jgi:hypothetical protein